MKIGFIAIALSASFANGVALNASDFMFNLTQYNAIYQSGSKKSESKKSGSKKHDCTHGSKKSKECTHYPTHSPAAPAPCSDVSVVITTDDNPAENYYTVTDKMGNFLMSSGPFADKRKTYTQTKCLPYDDYLFTIYDTAGNGICCENGPGGFNVYANGMLVEAGSPFTYSHSISLTTKMISPTMAPVPTSLCYGTCIVEGDKKSCTFTLEVDVFASELGYFKVKECGDEIMPTLGIEKGVTYNFLQRDLTNWMHAVGFAYYPGGAHYDVDELEPGIPPPNSASRCNEDMTCPAPMYLLNGVSLGKYSNNADIAPLTKNEEDFGLDVYEPQFFRPLTQWTEYGDYSVALKFDVEDFIDDIFYFCHIHKYMSARMKFVGKDGAPLNTKNYPEIPYNYEYPSKYDQQCGTYGIGQYQLPNDQCAKAYVCDVEQDGSDFAKFASCIDSMDCAMQVGMTTKVTSKSVLALFNHQMIPHHQNAVNMAKALLKDGYLKCDNILEETEDCEMLNIVYSIINFQNYQIQTMQSVLESKGYPEEDDCPVPLSSYSELQNTFTSKGKSKNTPKQEKKLCVGFCVVEGDKKSCTFTLEVDVYASELGYFKVKECGDEIMPTLGIEKGVTYNFIQRDLTNWMHAVGFAYYPGGAHYDVDELEPGIPPPNSQSRCGDDMTCPAPMYFLNGVYLEDFGLDVYEPQFFWTPDQWTEQGGYSAVLKFDVDDFTNDIFYFCHIHKYVSARMKFIGKDGAPLNKKDFPEIPYNYEYPSEYDQQCGTYGIGQYQLPNDQCAETYVCDVPEDEHQLVKFAGCIDSMDCAMQVGMSTGSSSKSVLALFNHQMIPHHQNAVNMAKALLKDGYLKCDNILDETDDCAMMIVVYDIMNTQNYQIQVMQNVLESNGYPEYDDCKVPIDSPTKPTPAPHSDDDDGKPVTTPKPTPASDDDDAKPVKPPPSNDDD